MNLIDAAIEYLNAGLPVIALSGKMPNSEFHPRGLNDPITGTVEPHGDHPADSYTYDGCAGCADRQALREVFGHSKTTGIGIPIPDHMVVVDIDGEEGAAQWREMVGDADLVPDTPAAKTGRGLHLWFATPREQGGRKLGPKLDLKGIGGYVAAPPSKHPDGHVYQWLEPLVVDGRVNATWLPALIEEHLKTLDQIAEENHVDSPPYTLYELSLQNGKWRLRRTENVPPPIDGLVHAVANADEGNRNNMLAWASLQARDEGVTLEDAMRDLGGAGEQAGLTSREIRTTIRSAYRRRSRP